MAIRAVAAAVVVFNYHDIAEISHYADDDSVIQTAIQGAADVLYWLDRNLRQQQVRDY